ncbi:hypothetical protein AR457_39000 [Streptomyces agglomeratus]|nr:hypothetical protein AR457_39000 [Streptomyces agglomeratus]
MQACLTYGTATLTYQKPNHLYRRPPRYELLTRARLDCAVTEQRRMPIHWGLLSAYGALLGRAYGVSVDL